MRFILLPIALFAPIFLLVDAARAQDNMPAPPAAVPSSPTVQEAMPPVPPQVPGNPATTRVKPDDTRIVPRPNNWRGTDIDWQAHVRSCQAGHGSYDPATNMYREPSGVMRACPR